MLTWKGRVHRQQATKEQPWSKVTVQRRWKVDQASAPSHKTLDPGVFLCLVHHHIHRLPRTQKNQQGKHWQFPRNRMRQVFQIEKETWHYLTIATETTNSHHNNPRHVQKKKSKHTTQILKYTNHSLVLLHRTHSPSLNKIRLGLLPPTLFRDSLTLLSHASHLLWTLLDLRLTCPHASPSSEPEVPSHWWMTWAEQITESKDRYIDFSPNNQKG